MESPRSGWIVVNVGEGRIFMKKLTMAALVAAQIMVAAQPAAAAEIIDDKGMASQRHGAFAGARLRVPLGGEGDRKARAGLAVAPIAQSERGDGSRRFRFGEGFELGLNGRDKAELAFGGTKVSQLVQGPVGPDGRRLGASTGKGLAIVGGILVLTALGVFVLLKSSE
jgi:hypothetical protein